MRIRWFIGALTLALVAPAVATALGGGSGGRVDLDVVTREFDSRTTSLGGTGQRVTSHTIGAGAFQVWAFYPVSPGSAVIHPCDEPAPTDEATYLLNSTSDILYATFATAEAVCLSSTVPIHVLVDRLGTVSPTPEVGRSQYVPLPGAIELYNAAVADRDETIEIPRPEELSGSATAAVVSIEVLTSSDPGYVTGFSCNRERPPRADISFAAFKRAANVAYVELDAGDDLCVYSLVPSHIRVRLLGELNPDGPNPAALPPSWRYVPGEVPAPSLRSIVPTRVLDTRFGVGRPGTDKVEPDEIVELAFGDDLTPTTSAVVINLTVNQPESDGFVTVWPCGGDRPVVSSLNFFTGDTVGNLVVAKVGPGGTVCLSGPSRTHLIADLNGTFERDGGLLAQPVDPERILDTRKAIGVPTTTKVSADDVLELSFAGSAVPDEAGAVTLNVTVTQAEADGYITAYPCDEPRPTASNLNHLAGDTVGNLMTSKLSTDGRLCLYTLATTHLVADLAAWYGAEQPAGFIDLEPDRYLDTRFANGVPTTTKVPAGSFIIVQIAGRKDVPAGADAVIMNVTATATEGDGFVTAWPCDGSMPTVSNLNYSANSTNGNLATVKLAANGTVCMYTLAAAHIVADVAGYLSDAPVEGHELVLE